MAPPQQALQVVPQGAPKPLPKLGDYAANFTDEAIEKQNELRNSRLALHIRHEWESFRNHSNVIRLRDDLLEALRTYNGRYSPQKLAEIRQFGGSTVYARISTVKCRGATSMLRDVYLGAKKPWIVEATPEPTLPDSVNEDIEALLQSEVMTLQQAGQQVDEGIIQRRRVQLQQAANRAALKTAKEQAKRAEQKLDDILSEGGFYTALGEFLVDLPIFKFACIKGPVVRNVTQLQWENGRAVSVVKPQMFWERVNPFNLYFSPGTSCVEDSDVIEIVPSTRSDISALIGLPGYDDEAITQALTDYDKGLVEYLDGTSSEQADEENRENPNMNRSGLISMLVYNGRVQGKMLREYGMTDVEVPDPIRDYSVCIWMVGRYLLKVQVNPNPQRRAPYYVTSFEKVPGSVYGHGLIELIADIQDVANATLRSLVNNLSISSGPQVSVNEGVLTPTTNPDTLYPWKRWRFDIDPMSGNTMQPVSFFQPQSNATELLAVYKAMGDMSDEISAIPRYITGSEKVGGAASTASGLSMLMGNASKVLQNVAGQVDGDILDPALQDLHTMVMLTDTTGTLRGDEKIRVRGVAVAIQKETDRMRKLEFLQLTGNPIDLQITGIKGRAAVLRAVSDDLGMPEAEVVPSDDELQAQMEQQQAVAMAQQEGDPNAQPDAATAATQQATGQAGPPQSQPTNSTGNPPPKPKPNTAINRPAEKTDNMHRTQARG